MRELPAGSDAALLDFSAEPDPLDAVERAAAALHRAKDGGALPTIADVIPAAATILVQAHPGSGIDTLGIHRALRKAGTGTGELHDTDLPDLVIPVSYDGPDLPAVADLIGRTIDEVVEIHRTTRWRVAFTGFAPGFGYLVPHDDPAHPLREVPRRNESRPRIPAGAVAVAAGYSAVYPRESPGGWHLIGHTDTPMWDIDATPPALLTPGRIVRFDYTTTDSPR